MRRRFRRRPGFVFLLAAAFALVIGFRLGWDWLWPGGREQFSGPAKVTAYRTVLFGAGPCTVLEVLPDNALLIQQERRTSAGGASKTVEGPVRLLGIRAPLESTGVGDESPAAAARQFAIDFLGRGQPTLSLDKRRVAEDGCFLAYCEVGGKNLNVELVRSGLALPDARPGDSATMARLLRSAEQEARLAGRGIWRPGFPLNGDE